MSLRRSILSLLICFQLAFPSKLWAQEVTVEKSSPPPPPQKIVPKYRPSLIVEGIAIPKTQLPNLPKFRSAFIKGFSDQPQVVVVEQERVAAWKKKFKFKEPPSHESYLTKGRNALAKGKKAYQQLEYQDALNELSIARKELITNLSHLQSNRDLLESHLYLAMTYIGLGNKIKKEDAKKKNDELIDDEFEKVVMLDPKRELSSHTYSPDVIKIFEKIKRRLVANRIMVKFDANVPDAKIYLNGKLLGATPYKEMLIPGDYYVLVEKKGMKSWTKLAKFQSPVERVTIEMQPVTEDQNWNELFQIREGGDQQSADIHEIDEMAQALNADMILLANLEKNDNDWRILGALYDVRTHEFSQTATVNVGPLDEFEPASYDLAEALAAMIRYDGYLSNSSQQGPLMKNDPAAKLAPDQPQTMQTVDAPKSEFYKKWWFWAALAGVGAGAYFGIQHFSGGSGSDINVNNEGNF